MPHIACEHRVKQGLHVAGKDALCLLMQHNVKDGQQLWAVIHSCIHVVLLGHRKVILQQPLDVFDHSRLNNFCSACQKASTNSQTTPNPASQLGSGLLLLSPFLL